MKSDGWQITFSIMDFNVLRKLLLSIGKLPAVLKIRSGSGPIFVRAKLESAEATISSKGISRLPARVFWVV